MVINPPKSELEVRPEPQKHPSQFQLRVRRFFASVWVELFVGGLIVSSVGFTLLEMGIETNINYQSKIPTTTQQMWLSWLRWINDFITVLFVVELSLRFYAASSKSQFFREFWVDIIATVPLFRVLRSARALRLLRLVRIIRLVGVFTRLSHRYPFIFRRGSIDFLIVCGMLIIAVLFGTVAVMHFESEAAARSEEVIPADEQFSLENSFWFAVYTLFAGEPTPIVPRTIAGRIVAVFVMFMGLTMFAIFAGTVSAFMVDRIQVEGRVVDWDEVFDHVIICGWTSKTEIIIREYRANKFYKQTPIVIIAEQDGDGARISNDIRENVIFLNDDFTRVSALERAKIHEANTCIILADTSGGRTEQDADARTILAALTVEKISPRVQTSAELLHRTYGTHLDLGQVNSYVVSGEYGAYMLAQEAMDRGSMGVIDELLTCQRGNEFYRYTILKEWIGMTFDELLDTLRKDYQAILVGVHPIDEEQVIVNPPEYTFQEGDQIVAISEELLELK